MFIVNYAMCFQLFLLDNTYVMIIFLKNITTLRNILKYVRNMINYNPSSKENYKQY